MHYKNKKNKRKVLNYRFCLQTPHRNCSLYIHYDKYIHIFIFTGKYIVLSTTLLILSVRDV